MKLKVADHWPDSNPECFSSATEYVHRLEIHRHKGPLRARSSLGVSYFLNFVSNNKSEEEGGVYSPPPISAHSIASLKSYPELGLPLPAEMGALTDLSAVLR